MGKLKVGILGATGMVGQRFITLLENHPDFEVSVVAASERSSGKTYREAVNGRWKMRDDIPESVAGLRVFDVKEVSYISERVDLVFSALDMDKQAIRALEEAYAEAGVAVVSNNSAHRWTKCIPMIIPEVNAHHFRLIDAQRKIYGWNKGFIVVKPNCSIQSYVLALAPLWEYGPKEIFVATYQAISGAGKLLSDAGEIIDNTIPLPGEEEKSRDEPLKIFGGIKDECYIQNARMKISAHCERVSAEDGHKAVVSVSFLKKPSEKQILKAWKKWKPRPQKLGCPSAPDPCIVYREEPDRPQTRLDRDAGNGMAVTIGRLRKCEIFDWKFTALSHNTVRGAAGGAILTAELLQREGYLK